MATLSVMKLMNSELTNEYKTALKFAENHANWLGILKMWTFKHSARFFGHLTVIK